MTYLVTLYALFAIVIGYELFTAPVAYEDDEGFHCPSQSQK